MYCLGDICHQTSASWEEKRGDLVFLMLMIQRTRDVIKIAKVQMRKVEMEIQGAQVG